MNAKSVVNSIINKLSIELKINRLIDSSYSEYLDEQAVIVETVKRVLEQSFADKFLGGKTMLIDRLDIDVRGKSIKEVLDKINIELIKALEKFNEVYAQELLREEKYRFSGTANDGTESYNVNRINANNAEKINSISSYVSDLLHFIEFGVFKWLTTQQVLTNKKLLKEVFLDVIGNQLTGLTSIISNSRQSAKRVLYNFPADLLAIFYNRLIINKTYNGLPVAEATEFFKLVNKKQGGEFVADIGAVILQEACRESYKQGYKANVLLLVEELTRYEKQKPAVAIAALIKRSKKILATVSGSPEKEKGKPHSGQLQPVKKKKEAREETEWNSEKPKLTQLEGTGRYIENAGMVIMLPYLPQFFSELKYVKNGAFVNEQKQRKACLILENLITGGSRFNEADLVLNKLACGVELETALPVRLWLTPRQKLLCREFLTAIRDEWAALKNTSVEYMCYTFFQRNGIIEKVDDGWRIKVEPRDLDILVESIPWGFRTVRQPWNDYMIFTEWG